MTDCELNYENVISSGVRLVFFHHSHIGSLAYEASRHFPPKEKWVEYKWGNWPLSRDKAQVLCLKSNNIIAHIINPACSSTTAILLRCVYTTQTSFSVVGAQDKEVTHVSYIVLPKSKYTCILYKNQTYMNVFFEIIFLALH